MIFILIFPIDLCLTFNLVVSSFLDIFFNANFNSSGIKASSSAENGFNPKIVALKSTFSMAFFDFPSELVNSSADLALLDGCEKVITL